MTSDVQICNSALTKLGHEDKIAAIGQDGVEGETCALMYPQIRDLLLASHPWNFAIGRSALSQNAVSPDFEFDNQFLLPGDYLRGLSLYNTECKWKIESGNLLTDSSTANLVYIKKVTNTGKYSALFVEALATRLAAEIGKTIGNSAAEVRQLFAEFKSKFSEAKTRDGQEGTAPVLTANSFYSGIKDSNLRF
jgi:hypothetical protein